MYSSIPNRPTATRSEVLLYWLCRAYEERSLAMTFAERDHWLKVAAEMEEALEARVVRLEALASRYDTNQIPQER